MTAQPELIPLDQPFQTMRNVWTVKLLKVLAPKPEQKGWGYTWEFSTLTERRRLTYWVAEEELAAANRTEQIRQEVRDWLDYTNEARSVMDPAGLSRR